MCRDIFSSHNWGREEDRATDTQWLQARDPAKHFTTLGTFPAKELPAQNVNSTEAKKSCPRLKNSPCI